MIKWIKDLFHTHAIIYTSRVLVGYGSKDLTMGPVIDIQPTNIYLVEGYCTTCDVKFKRKRTILEIFDKPQPYDKEPEDVKRI